MLRSSRINFRKNWVVQPSKWNLFWESLELDMRDILEEMSNTSFSYTAINSATEDIVQNAGKDTRIRS